MVQRGWAAAPSSRMKIQIRYAGAESRMLCSLLHHAALYLDAHMCADRLVTREDNVASNTGR